MDKPENIPSEAEWNETLRCWEAGSTENGKKHGAYKEWREDGTMLCSCRYQHGVKNGAYRRFHESGEVSQKGSFKADNLHGPVEWLRTEGETSEPFYADLGPKLWRATVQYDQGTEISVRYFSKSGDRLLENGDPFPTHPRGVPSMAEYDSKEGRWNHGQKNENGHQHGLYMSWTQDGILVEECEYRNGKREGACKQYSDAGELTEEGYFSEDAKNGTWRTYAPDSSKLVMQADYEDNVFHGSVIEYGPDGRSRIKAEYENGMKTGSYIARVSKEKYRGGTIRIENGQYRNDHAVGRWKLLDKSAKTVTVIDFGVPRTTESSVAASKVFLDDNKSAQFWKEMTAELTESRMMGESILSAARHATKERDASTLVDSLEKLAAPLSKKNSDKIATEATDNTESPLSTITNALLRGGNAERLFTALAEQLHLDNRFSAAIDFARAALLVDPDAHHPHALLARNHIYLGEKEEAGKDVQRLKEAQNDETSLYEGYLQILFPEYGFWADPALLQSAEDNGVLEISRSLDEITHVIHVSAMRMKALRDELMSRLQTIMMWLPPDPTPLLPGHETQLDSHEDINTSDRSIPDLLGAIRIEWTVLSWLCWSAGCDRIALPNQIAAPPEFPRAVSYARTGLQRAKEVLAGNATDGDLSWSGQALQDYDRALQTIAESEFSALDTMMRWLTEPSVGSPWPLDTVEE
jgi:antitoxin component YwqK of YwqJK toxin-antitoxin module